MEAAMFNRFTGLMKTFLKKETLSPVEHQSIVEIFCAIQNKYKNRAYHNLTHIEWCLDKFVEIAPLIHKPTHIELAIWFHDIVYNRLFFPSLNEEKSVTLMKRLIKEGVPYHTELIIKSTKVGSPFPTNECEYMHDIDYSILAADWPIFVEYRQNIRKEFWYYPLYMYKKREIAFLQYCLKTPIFVTDYFKPYEQVAKSNINNYLDELHSKQ